MNSQSAPQDEYDQYLDDNPLPFAFIDLFSTPELTTVPSTPIAEPFSAGSRRNVQLMTPLSVPPPPKGKGKEREQPVHWPEFQDDPVRLYLMLFVWYRTNMNLLYLFIFRKTHSWTILEHPQLLLAYLNLQTPSQRRRRFVEQLIHW